MFSAIRLFQTRHLGMAKARSLATARARLALPSTMAVVILSGPLACAMAAPPSDLTVQERLEQTRVSVDFEDVSLGKVVEQLRSEHRLNIYVNESALQMQGIGLSTPITLRLTQAPLTTVLRLLLRDAGAGAATLTYVVEDGVIVISTADDTSARPIVRMYDVSDLLDSGFAQRRLMNTPLLRLQLSGGELQGAEASGGSAAQNPFLGGGGGSGELDQAGVTFERLSDLIELIQATVIPESWRDAGGIGSIVRQGNRLIVTADPVVHNELAGLLTLLRSELPRTIDLDLCLMRVSPSEAEALRKELAEDWPRMSVVEAAKIEVRFAAKGSALLRMTLTGPSGQSQMVSSLQQEDYVARVQAVVDEGAVAYQPVIAQANSGIELMVLPVLSPDGASLALDVSLALAPQGQLGQTTFVKRDGEELKVQTRSAGLQTLLCKVRLDLGQAILLTVPPAEVPSSKRADAVYLLIRPHVK